MRRALLKLWQPSQHVVRDRVASLPGRPHAYRLLATARTKLAAARTSAGQGAHVVSPIDFGADPSGATDSSDAFDKAVQAM